MKSDVSIQTVSSISGVSTLVAMVMMYCKRKNDAKRLIQYSTSTVDAKRQRFFEYLELEIKSENK